MAENETKEVAVTPKVAAKPVALSPEIIEFLNEFAHNDKRRKELLDAIQNKTSLDGGKYFQARFKKVAGL